MHSTLNFFLHSPFFQGLILGLLVAGAVWLQGMLKKNRTDRELTRLRDGLSVQMSTAAQNSASHIKENEELRKKLAAMEATFSTLSQKPKRAELKTLYIYDKAIHLMYARTPGFATAWESVLKEAESEMAKAESGLIPLMKKVFHPSLAPRTEIVEEPASEAEREGSEDSR